MCERVRYQFFLFGHVLAEGCLDGFSTTENIMLLFHQEALLLFQCTIY